MFIVGCINGFSLLFGSSSLSLSSAASMGLGPVHTNPFSKENGAVFLRFQKDLRPHL